MNDCPQTICEAFVTKEQALSIYRGGAQICPDKAAALAAKMGMEVPPGDCWPFLYAKQVLDVIMLAEDPIQPEDYGLLYVFGYEKLIDIE